MFSNLFCTIFLLICTICYTYAKPSLSRSSIINGKPAKLGQFPFMASIEFYNYHWCGGSLIASSVILTAAHCTEGPFKVFAEDLQVRVGHIKRSSGGQLRQVIEILPHPLYNHTGNIDYDIALHLVEKPFNTNVGFVKKISLVKFGYEFPKNSKGFVAGWGTTERDYDVLADTLQYINVDLFDHEHCVEYYNSIDIEISNSTICAGSLAGDRDSCRADSGGPLVIGTKTKLIQLGIVSAGDECARAGVPGLYTDIAKVRDWIDENVNILLDGSTN